MELKEQICNNGSGPSRYLDFEIGLKMLVESSEKAWLGIQSIGIIEQWGRKET